MGLFNFSKRVKIGKSTRLNLSKSGASVSKKIGGVTFNSRGTASVKGIRFGGKKRK